MYSIVLVEDEKSIRENIQKGILWEKYGFYIAAEASNGEQALEMIEKLQPDILLTDIKMPFMDGLELSRIAKRLFPAMHIVILSGYMEFGYAREAISIGVEEYLIKPITPVKLIRTFSNLKAKLDEEFQQAQHYSAMMRELHSMEEQLAARLTGKIRAEDLSEEGKREAVLWEFLQKGSEADIEAFTRRYIESCDEGLLDSLMYRSWFMVQTLVTCMKAVETLGGSPTEIFGNIQDVNAYVLKIASPDGAREEIKPVLKAAITFRDRVVDQSAKIVRSAKEYIQEHYQDGGLVVGDVAGYVGFSTGHFSYVFKQKTGCGFVEYLTQIRIKKAKELLRSTAQTITEISEEVGYNNANYFSAVFHKTVGMTPKEYRDR